MKNKTFTVQAIRSMRDLEDFVNTNGIAKDDIVDVKEDNGGEYYLLYYK